MLRKAVVILKGLKIEYFLKNKYEIRKTFNHISSISVEKAYYTKMKIKI